MTVDDGLLNGQDLLKNMSPLREAIREDSPMPMRTEENVP
jgi:hypothetical protein